jgi:hypothetical protein
VVRRAVKRALAGGAVLACLLGAGGNAWAAPCVSISLDAAVLDGAGRGRLVEQLSASLKQHDIATCSGGEQPLAEVVFEASEREVAITIRDAVTRKVVMRNVRLAPIPHDGRPLALAVAADELLRASWAEILLARAPAPPPEPPPEVRQVVEASLVAPVPLPGDGDHTAPTEPPGGGDRAAAANERPHALFLVAAVAGEHATGGLSLGGIDLRIGGWIAPRVAVGIRLGARVAPSAQGNDGTAAATALVGGVGGALAILPRGRVLALELPVRFDVESVAFRAHPLPGADGSNVSAIGLTASTGLSLGLAFAPGWALQIEGTVGVVLRDVDAKDGTSTLTALSGADLGGALGVRASL